MRKKLVILLMCICAMSAITGCSKGKTTDNKETQSDKKYNVDDYVKLGKYTGLEVDYIKYEATQDDYDTELNTILSESAYHKEIKRKEVKDKDIINVDFSVVNEKNDELINQMNDYQFTIGDENEAYIVDGVTDKLIGEEVGKEISVKTKLPKDYAVEDLRNAKVVYKFKIKAILDKKLTTPKYTDDFVKEYTNDEYKSTKDYDKFIWNKVKMNAELLTTDMLESKISQTLSENCEVEKLPDGLLDETVAERKAQDEEIAKSYNMEFKDFVVQYYNYASEEEYDKNLKTYCETYLKQKLIYEAIEKKENIKLEDGDVDVFLERYAKYNGFEKIDDLLKSLNLETVDDFVNTYGKDTIEEASLNIKLWNYVISKSKTNAMTEEEYNKKNKIETPGTEAPEATTSSEPESED